MKISTKGRYALRLMVDLAVHDDGNSITLKDISLRQGVSMKYLERIVAQLCIGGLLRSVRGPQGGYHLTRAVESYTVGHILRVTEGSLAPVACLDDAPNQCPRRASCSTLPFWEGLYDVINQYVDGTTLRALADLQKERDEPVI